MTTENANPVRLDSLAEGDRFEVVGHPRLAGIQYMRIEQWATVMYQDLNGLVCANVRTGKLELFGPGLKVIRSALTEKEETNR